MLRSRQGRQGAGVVLSMLVCLVCAGPGLAQQDNNLIYQIFVRSFADTAGDTAPAGSPGEIGDLKGLREKLDYLNDGNPKTDTDLEVGILWLMPIFPSTSYHGYQVTDFNNVNPDYGSLQDLQDLVQAAHQRGVRIILDIPFNHTSTQHPWFQQALNDPASPFRKFYHFRDASQAAPPGSWHKATGSTGNQVWYLGVFDKDPTMADLNFDEPAVRRAVKAIAKFWLNQGIDGFRLDAVKHIYGITIDDLSESVILHNNDWWREFSDDVGQAKPSAVLIGEVLGDRWVLRRHAYGNDALLDEPFMKGARSQIAYPGSNFVIQWRDFVDSCRTVNHLAHLGPGYLPRSEPFQACPYLASHDADPRLASYLEQAKNDGMKSSVDEAYRLGMYLLLSMGEYPILYYGDEVMQCGRKSDGSNNGPGVYDETLREPFPWHKAGNAPPQTGWFTPHYDQADDGVSVEEQEAPGKMLDLVRGLTNLRTQHPGFTNGELAFILADTPEWLVFEKVSNTDRYLVLINSTAQGKNYGFHQDWYPRYIGARLIFWSDGQQPKWQNETDTGKHIGNDVYVAPYGMVLLQQKQP